MASEMPKVNITLVLFTRGGVHSGLAFQEFLTGKSLLSAHLS